MSLLKNWSVVIVFILTGTCCSLVVAEQEAKGQQVEDKPDDDTKMAPAEKSLNETLQADQENEYLKKHKEQLLGGSQNFPMFPEDPRNVILKQMALVVEGREDETLDLDGDITKLKHLPLCIKEQTKYRMKISFYVQREIVSGLKYIQITHRKGIRVDKSAYMVGSYGPKEELSEFQTPEEVSPSGMLSRGDYVVKSSFTDDDKHTYLEWEWILKVSKDCKE